MTTIQITLPENYVYSTKINGIEVNYTPQTMHESWLLRLLEKGIQRYANDMYSGEKGNTKLDLCRALAADANSGKELEVKQRMARLPDDMALAVKNAKADLLLIFKQVTSQGRIADMIGHEKVAPFFKETADSVVWNTDTVQAWMKKKAESGGKDYVAEAKASLAASAMDLDLDL